MSVLIPFSSFKKAHKEVAINNLTKFSSDGTQSFDAMLFRQYNGIRYVHIPFNFSKTVYVKSNDDQGFLRRNFEFTGCLFKMQEPYYEEAMQYLHTHNSVSINLWPGFGKTVISVCISSNLGYLGMVILGNSTHVKQWYETCKQFSTASVWCVGDNQYEIPDKIDFIICLYTRVHTIPSEILSKVGTLIIDECDTLCNRTGTIAMLLLTPKYVIGLTATYEREDGLHKILDCIIGEDNIIRPKQSVEFLVFKVSTDFIPERKHTYQNRLDWSHYLKSLMYNNERNVLILQICFDLLQRGEKIIVITAEKRHAKEFSELANEHIRDLGYTSDYFTGDKKEYQDCDILVGNYSICGRGFDEAKYCSTFNGIRISSLVMTITFKSNSALYQCVGRVLRSKYPKVYQLVDKDNTLRKHWSRNVEWYRKIGASICDYSADYI